jgi:serine/threonine-protein kinase
MTQARNAPPPPHPCPEDTLAAPRAAPLLAGRYELVRALGHGASGSTHLARDRQLGRLVAVKVLDRPDPDALARFRREALIAARLRHPSIVVLHELHAEGERPFLVLQYVDGEPLTHGGMGRRRMVEVARTIAAALHHAHRNGIVHRDVKPENILIDSAGRAHLIDFGLSRDVTGHSGETLSLRGDITGTPWSMAPEQASGRVDLVDARSDVYSLGATLYWGLTGCRPFEAASLVDLLHAVIHDEPPTLRSLDPRIPRELERIVLRCLKKDRSARYQSASELIRDLDRVLARRPARSRLPEWVRRARHWLLGARHHETNRARRSS